MIARRRDDKTGEYHALLRYQPDDMCVSMKSFLSLSIFNLFFGGQIAGHVGA